MAQLEENIDALEQPLSLEVLTDINQLLRKYAMPF